jgi:FMN hydrolase / 5-amino-6-(5-phospho-D-ribitylamino)uracil phosphatase
MSESAPPTGTRPPFDPTAIKGVLFDAYGTLFEYGNPQFRIATASILADQSLEPDFEQFHQSWVEAYAPSGVWGADGPTRQDPYRERVLNGPLPPWHSQWEIWRRQFAVALDQHRLDGDPDRAADELRHRFGESDPYPDAHDTVELLAGAGLTVGLLSNADEDFLQRALSRARLRFSVIQSSESLRVYKPHRAVFLAACERLHCEPNETLYVGDSPIADVGGAHNAGLRTAWIRRPPERSDESIPEQTAADAAARQRAEQATADMLSRLPEPDLTIETLLEIPPALRRRNP